MARLRPSPINVNKALGVTGVVTNGSVRDIDMLPGDFQVLAGKFEAALQSALASRHGSAHAS